MEIERKRTKAFNTDDILINDIIRVAAQLGKTTITQVEYTNSHLNKFNGMTISNRLKGWNNALKKAGLPITRFLNISDDELKEDIRRVANQIAPKILTQTIYNKLGKHCSLTINRRLGWNKVLESLGLMTSMKPNIPENELFNNLAEIWSKLGHTPDGRYLVKFGSKYSQRPFINKFGSWGKTVKAFTKYINADIEKPQDAEATVFQENNLNTVDETSTQFQHKTSKDITARLKVQVLLRDKNKCRLCGITVKDNDIHFDHIKAWSKGGETILDNIQVLCTTHKLEKDNSGNAVKE